MKKNLIIILVVACFVSVLNIVAVVNSNNDASFQTYAESKICTAQGDFMPEPYEDLLIAPIAPNKEIQLFCSAQGDVPPPAWDDEDTLPGGN